MTDVALVALGGLGEILRLVVMRNNEAYKQKHPANAGCFFCGY